MCGEWIACRYISFILRYLYFKVVSPLIEALPVAILYVFQVSWGGYITVILCQIKTSAALIRSWAPLTCLAGTFPFTVLPHC